MEPFIVQRLHPRLAPGRTLRAGSKFAVHCFQGDLDSACALWAVFSAFAILGRIGDPATVSSRKRGQEAALWDRAVQFIFTGIDLQTLADEVIREASGGSLRPTVFEGAHGDVIDFCERELSRGHLVIVSWRPVGQAHWHAVLAVGSEGRMQGRRFQPHALLILDPAERDAPMATCNARLDYANAASGKRARCGTYITARDTLSVVVDGAVSIRSSTQLPAGTSKPP